jgi:hypothetical protein
VLVPLGGLPNVFFILKLGNNLTEFELFIILMFSCVYNIGWVYRERDSANQLACEENIKQKKMPKKLLS